MKIGDNDKDYNLDKISEYIDKNNVINGDDKDNLGCIFDYFDALDGVTDGKINKKTLTTIFNAIKNMDCEIKDNKLSDEEIKKYTQKHLSGLLINVKNIKIKQLRIFFSKLLEINETARFEYKLGKKNENCREIDTSNLAKRISPDIGKIYLKTTNVDSKIGAFKQGLRGDCYLLAEISAINNTEKGKQILANNIKKMNDGSVVVTLPGANKVRKELENKYPHSKSKIEISGQYHITKNALFEVGKHAGNEYSAGDMDVICIELAFEAYREELIQTRKNLNIKDTRADNTAEGAVAGHSENDILSNGQSYDAGFILTGKQSDVYKANKNKHPKLYKPGSYGFISRKKMNEQAIITSKGVPEISNLTDKELDLYKMLMSCKGKESVMAITASVVIAEDGPDGTTKKKGRHAISVCKITNDTVYVLNPWYKDDNNSMCIEPVPIGDFLKMAVGLVIQNMENNPNTNENRTNIESILSAVSQFMKK